MHSDMLERRFSCVTTSCPIKVMKIQRPFLCDKGGESARRCFTLPYRFMNVPMWLRVNEPGITGIPLSAKKHFAGALRLSLEQLDAYVLQKMLST